MSIMGKPIQCRVDEYLQQYTQLPYICGCNNRLHAYHLGISGMICENHDQVWLNAYVLPPLVFFVRHCDCNCVDKHENVVIKMHKHTKRHIVDGASSIFVANALVVNHDGTPLLDVFHEQGFVLRDFQSRVKHDHITTAEMCAGGFAGWLHASSVCNSRGANLKPLFAVEWDEDICDAYCKNWKDAQKIGDLESFHLLMQSGHYPIFSTDIQMGWWLSCIGRSVLDLMFLSAPCQPWSSASSGKGLLSEDGWSSLVALVVAAYLRPKLVGWEQVSGIQKHKHWSILKSVAYRCGFEFVVESKCNLSNVSPQNRERLLVLLRDRRVVSGDIDLRIFDFPSFDLKSMTGFKAIMHDISDFEEHVSVDSKTLDMYLDEKLLPKNHDGKKMKMDMMTYRLKLPCDGFGCIMASYTSQHEIDIQQLREKGLFGTLLHEGGRIRFLCGPECAVLMMPCVDTFIPSNRRLHMKILGNAIATAHASFLIGGMIYILGSHREQFITPTQMILDTLKTRLHFGNAEVIKVEDGWILQRKSEIPLAIDCDPYEVPISPTMGEPKLIKTVITCGEWKITGWVETQFCATEILQFFGVYEDGLIAWFLRTSDKITIVLKKPFLTPLTLINWSNPASVGVMVFCRGEFVLMKRTENMSNREVLDIIGNHTDIRIKNMCLCNIIGKRTCEDDVTLPVSMLISSCIDQSARWHSTLPEFEKKSGCITASMPIHEYQRFVSILKTFGIDQFVAIWGWHVKTSNTMTGSTIGYIHFQRSIEAFVLTTEIFNDMLAMWILRLVLPPVDALDIHRPVDVTIRFYGVCLWNGTVDGSWTLDMLCSSWNSTMKAFNKDCEIRNVVLGKRHNYEDVLETILPENSQSMRISWVLPVHGGGAKDENRFVAKNRLASLLLLHGVPLAVVADYAENVIKSISPWKLLQELAKGENTKNWIAVKEWLHKMGHPVPSSDHNLEVAARKIQNAIRKRKDLPIQKISASQVNIIPDHFLRHDKTPAVVLKTLMDAKTGVILMDSQEALPWINSDKHLSSDSLACIVLGHTCTCDKKDSCNKVSVPILDAHQQPALVAGCMHQLGSKPILLPQENNVNIAMDKSQIMCFTIYKDECDSDFWKCVMQNPVKSVIQVIKEHCDSMFMTCSPWGRSWRDGKDNSTIEDATSFQFHARVKQDCVDSIMQISGRGPVYCTPKSEDKGLLEGWAVIWLKAPKRDILIQASKMSIQHAGLVRTLKGMGVRVAQKDFDATFKILRPSDKPPPSIAAKYLYKLQPLPSGMTAENVQEFTTSKGWETRPMRALGRASWLVASEKESPQTWLSLNGKLVLVKEIQQSKPRDPPIILAGKVAIDSKSKQDVPRLTDPWLQQNEDPWLKYQPTQHTPSVASGSSASTVQHSMTDPSLAKRLKEQDDKITSLQSSLQDMKKFQQKQEIDNKTFQSDLDMRLKTMKAEVSDQFNGLSSKFEGSLQAALARQDSQINAGFSELKSLFMQSRGCSEENKSKKPKKGTGKGNDHDVRVDSDQEMAPSPAK